MRGLFLFLSSKKFATTELLWCYHYSTRYKERCNFDTNKIVYAKIDPNLIQSVVKIKDDFCPLDGQHAVDGELNGIWNTNIKPLEKTKGYNRIINAIQTRTEEQLKRTNVVQSMEEEDYVPQDHKQLKLRDHTITDEPRLAVSRDNELLRWRGVKHRIAAAQVLDLEYIYAYL